MRLVDMRLLFLESFFSCFCIPISNEGMYLNDHMIGLSPGTADLVDFTAASQSLNKKKKRR